MNYFLVDCKTMFEKWIMCYQSGPVACTAVGCLQVACKSSFVWQSITLSLVCTAFYWLFVNFYLCFPSGYYCPAGTRWAYEFPCPKGSYNPVNNSNGPEDCLACPQGQYCQCKLDRKTEALRVFFPFQSFKGTLCMAVNIACTISSSLYTFILYSKTAYLCNYFAHCHRSSYAVLP